MRRTSRIRPRLYWLLATLTAALPVRAAPSPPKISNQPPGALGLAEARLARADHPTVTAEPLSGSALQVTAPRAPTRSNNDSPTAAAQSQGAPSRPKVDLQKIIWEGDKAKAHLENGDIAVLTLDQRLQERTLALLERAHAKKAAAVVIDVKTSKVLVWAELPRGPLGLLMRDDTPSASLMKIVTSAALLERTVVTPRWSVCSRGGQHEITMDHLSRPTTGTAECGPFWQALGFSRNAAYAQLTHRYLSARDLTLIGKRYGFNRPLPFDSELLMGSLVVPKDSVEKARTAIGFENAKLSVLGAAHLAHVVALGGQVPRVKIVESAPGYPARHDRRMVGRALSAMTARRLRWMMEVTVHSGTSREAFTDPEGRNYLGDIRAAGKTGTLDLKDGCGTFASWFTGFAPSQNPEIVVAVLLHNKQRWHQKANQVARDIFRSYFANKGSRGVKSP